MAQDRDGRNHGGNHLRPAVPAILAMADCVNGDSDVQRLIDAAAEYLIEMGVDVTILDLQDLRLPHFFEAQSSSTIPSGVYGLRQLLCAHDGFLIALPPRDDSQPPILMNAIEWSLSAALGDRPVSAYTGKCAALMAITSNERAAIPAFPARATLANLGVTVLPEELLLPGGSDSFAGGQIADESARSDLAQLMDRLVGTIRWVRRMPITPQSNG